MTTRDELVVALAGRYALGAGSGLHWHVSKGQITV